MLCPRCKVHPLTHHELHGQELDLCPTCHGIWFEDGELTDAIREKHRLEDDDYCVRQGFGQPMATHEYRCPECRRSMQQFHLLKDYQVTLDACNRCRGVWVDGDEVSQVLAAPKLQKALERLNQKVSIKSWLFQFLTQMPREYNIKPKRKPWMTWLLLAVNLVIFSSYGFSEATTTHWVIQYFAVDSEPLLRGERLWTLLSYQFLHGGWMHLLGNLYFLWIIGDNLEDAVGPWRYLGLYLVCGLAAALLELIASHVVDRRLLMVGASGSIAGLFGMYLLWFRHASLTFMFVVWQKKLHPGWYFAIWLAFNLFGALAAEGGVAYWAHIGGFVVGLAAGVWLRPFVLAQNPIIRLLQQPEARILR